MPRLLRWATTLTSSLAIAVGVGLTQSLPMFGSSNDLYGARSLDELVTLRDQLIEELETPVQEASEPGFLNSVLSDSSSFYRDRQLFKQLKDVEVQILIERRANDNWKQAIRLATEAIRTDESNSSDSLAIKKQSQQLWKQAIGNLNEIPENSLIAHQASDKSQQYQVSLMSVTKEIQLAQTTFLEKIRDESDLSKTAMISVCNLSRDCAHLRGEQPPASPASLIKVPIAVALLDKLAQENISLEKEVYVDGGNFTEDASNIRARTSYPLKTLMGEMIDHSSNIATNQLIDYLGQDFINKTLEKQGFKETKVKFKLMGDRIMPRRPGSGRNRLTSAELTEMMVKTYNYEYPGAEALIEALNRQYDRAIGYAALEDLEAQWLGEKTGQNSRVLGTTLAVSIDGERYIITVIDNNTGHIFEIRKAISKIAEHIIQNGHL
ncbi:serine hydrolase [Capilliphycus salinus ALCB114379]|uniref:serine hydrolase n=1 Tax=Capilliphycus salinus TaxID=2768948 RepID=UPI0039A5AAC6